MIGGISFGGASNSYYNMAKIYRSMSSGRRINSSADDAAGLGIAKKMQAQQTDYTQRNRNAKDEQNALNIQDGKLSTTTDALQRIRDLSVQASNGTYGTQEKRALQSEVNQLKDFIGKDKIEELGLTGYNVMDNPDISAVDKALDSVSSERGTIGAQSNGMDHQMNARAIANENTAASRSQIEDLDYGAMFNRVNTEQTLFQMRLMMQKNHQQMQRGASAALLGML